jgi:hypothetical protein
MDPSVDSKAVSVTLSPRGFRKLKQTYIGFTNADMIEAGYATSQNGSNSSYAGNVFLGWDFGNPDNDCTSKQSPNNVDFEILG